MSENLWVYLLFAFCLTRKKYQIEFLLFDTLYLKELTCTFFEDTCLCLLHFLKNSFYCLSSFYLGIGILKFGSNTSNLSR